MLNPNVVGTQIARLRKLNGYTQDRLARLLHVSPQAVSKWENGHALPETSLLPVLSDIFKCTIDQILMPAYTSDESLIIERINEMLIAYHIAPDKEAALPLLKHYYKCLSRKVSGYSYENSLTITKPR